MRIPPPLLALAVVMTQKVVARGGRPRSPSRRVVAVATAAGSGALPFSALRQFRRSGTTVDPEHPERATALVTTGPFAVTRNPMYLGLTGLLVANAVRQGSLASLLPVAAFVAVIDRVQIPAEESALRELFGAEYDAYLTAVPRWLSTRSLDLGGL